MPRHRYVTRKIAEGRYIIFDTFTGREAVLDGNLYGELPGTQAHFGADIMNWLDMNPPLPVEPWLEDGDQ